MPTNGFTGSTFIP